MFGFRPSPVKWQRTMSVVCVMTLTHCVRMLIRRQGRACDDTIQRPAA